MDNHQVEINLEEIKVRNEGRVEFITEFICSSQKNADEIETTFYNPVQVFNRDISLLMTYAYAKKIQKERGDKFEGIRFYDALSASGLNN